MTTQEVIQFLTTLKEEVEEKIKIIGEPQGFNESSTWSKGRKEGLEDCSSIITEHIKRLEK